MKVDTQAERKQQAELELLVSKKHNGNLEGEFKADTQDKRFEAVLQNKEYAIDPTHKHFRKIEGSEFLKEQQTKRRKLHGKDL